MVEVLDVELDIGRTDTTNKNYWYAVFAIGYDKDYNETGMKEEIEDFDDRQEAIFYAEGITAIEQALSKEGLKSDLIDKDGFLEIRVEKVIQLDNDEVETETIYSEYIY